MIDQNEQPHSDSLGALLKRARLEQALELSSVAKLIRVPEHHLLAFEENDHWRLPDSAYTKLYIKAYAKFLGFNVTTFMQLFDKERAQHLGSNQRRNVRLAPVRELPAWRMAVAPRIIRTSLVVIAALAITAYFGYEFKRMVAPPVISIIAPADGLVTESRVIEVQGATNRENDVRVNGKAVSPDDTGFFTDQVELQEGLNVITVKGSRKHSKEMTYTRRVIVTPTERPTASLPTYGPRVPVK
jgi:hypothetical protein